MPMGLQTFGPSGSTQLDTTVRTGRVIGIEPVTCNMLKRIRVPRDPGEEIWWYSQVTGQFGVYAGLVSDDYTRWDATNNLLQIQEGYANNIPDTHQGTGFVIYGVA